MKHLRDEKGVALITALLLTLIGLAIVMTFLYIVMLQTQVSGAHKRYRTALEASQGGAELFTKQVIPYIFANQTTGGLAGRLTVAGINSTLGSSTCIVAKLSNAPSDWPAYCVADSKPFDPTSLPDATFTLQGTQAPIKVFSKIVDTVPGNSDLSGFEMLDSGAGVAGVSSGVAPKHNPAMYRIEVQAEKSNNPLEKGQVSVLYAY